MAGGRRRSERGRRGGRQLCYVRWHKLGRQLHTYSHLARSTGNNKTAVGVAAAKQSSSTGVKQITLREVSHD